MKKKRNLYIVAFLCFITLVGVTIAYLQSTDVFENIFNAGTYSVITHEEFTSPTNWIPGDTTPKTITTTNEGTIPVRVRVKFDESWISSNDEELPLNYAGTKSASIINLDNQIDWLYKEGYYYYLHELLPGEETTSPISSVTFNPEYEGNITCTFNQTTNSDECISSEDGYMGGTYTLSITTETVQANMYETLWDNVPIMYDYVGDNPCTYNGELVPGAEYVNGQYKYLYRYSGTSELKEDGWNVRLIDKDSTDSVTTKLCTSINDKPIVSMKGMFSGSQATSIDLSSFDTSNVTEMNSMFYKSKATNLDLSSFDTKNLTSMNLMFAFCEATTINVSGFDTSNVTSMLNTFQRINVNSINLNSFNTSNVTTMMNMFTGAVIPTLDLSSFDTSNVTNMMGMFSSSEIGSLDLSSFDTSNVTNMMGMFSSSKIGSLDLSSFNTSNVTTMYQMFARIKTSTLDLRNFDTSNVTTMGYMFAESEIQSLNLTSFDTSSVTYMACMFANLEIDSLDLSSFNTSNVTEMGGMFGYTKIQTLDLSSFDTNSSTKMARMFYHTTATIGYAKTQADAARFNASSDKPSTLTFVVKSS